MKTVVFGVLECPTKHRRRQQGGVGQLPPVPYALPLRLPPSRREKNYVPSRPFPFIVAA